jgi:hypothetical protein
MSKVSQLLPSLAEGTDVLGNTFKVHLLGFTPSGLDHLNQLPNLYMYDAESGYHYFLRFEFTGPVEDIRRQFRHYNFEVLVSMYCELIVAHVRHAGVHVPEGARISDVAHMLRVFMSTGVTHTFGWLYRGTSQSFIFEVGVVFFHIYNGEPSPKSFSVMIDDVRHHCEILTSPSKLQLDPWALFDVRHELFEQLATWFNEAVSKSPYIHAKFTIPH